MPDGTGDDDYGSPTLTQLKQMSWDLSYIRDKLTLNNVSKTFIWRRSGTGYQMILGLIDFDQWGILGSLRSMATRIQSGEDGPAPPVDNFGQSGWTQTQLQAMYDNLNMISSKIMSGKRTFTMRMSGMAGSSVMLTLGDIESSSVSYRMAIQTMANMVLDGKG